MIFNLVGKGGSGGGGVAVVEKTLNFYDYNGTLVDSYASNEIQSLSALPSAPDHSTDWCPLTFQEWNWSLADIKAYNTAYPDGIINVGATYVPTDGKTHIKFKIGDYDGNGVQFIIETTGGTVNWGDGNTATISSTSLSHVYSTAGEYDCTLTGITSLTLYISGTVNQKYYLKVTDVRLGNSVTSIGGQAFSSCFSLQSITIPSSVTSIGSNAFYNCFSLQSITIPSSVTSIGNYAFSSCFSLQSITIPSSVTSIGSNAFSSCYSLYTVIVERTSPPRLLSTNAFSTSYQKRIWVPSSAVSTYKSASNWSSFSSIISANPN